MNYIGEFEDRIKHADGCNCRLCIGDEKYLAKGGIIKDPNIHYGDMPYDIRCPFWSQLTRAEQQEYSMLAPQTNGTIWLSLFLGIIGGIIIIAIYYSWYNNELSKFNYKFKKDIDAKRLISKKGD